MGQVPAKQFQRPQAIGASSQNGTVSQAMKAPDLPQNALQPLIQNAVPTVQSPNAVPQNGVAGSNNYSPLGAYKGMGQYGKVNSEWDPEEGPMRFGEFQRPYIY
jgi:hypothetical protein